MFKVLFSTFTLLASYTTFACNIQSFDKVVVLSNSPLNSLESLIAKTDCDAQTINSFVQAIQKTKGTINSRIVSEIINKEIMLKPNTIRVSHINQIVKDRILSGSDRYFFVDNTSRAVDSVIGLTSEESLSVKCNNCKTTGNKNIQMSVYNPLSGKNKKYWITGRNLIKAQALVARRNISFSETSLSKSTFELKEVYSDKPEQFFVNPSKLVFYKVNKPIKKGAPLKFNDLHSIYLIQSGKPATVLFKNNSLSLSSIAMPLRSARFGETVPLKNQKTKKTIIGKVVDFNKVVVEL
ncbi:MAG: flagellar basal body P-ring formation protein FlgA [Oligoflexia bacterium]|nr:flagellar basal body P-ring formation protein FlgA [Oligoflexia bacterium]